MTRRLLILSTFLMFLGSALTAQLTINNAQTPAQLVQNVLLGAGITVQNVTFTGDPLQIGEFTNVGNNNLGLGNGIIMSTGTTPGLPVVNNQAGGQTYAVNPPGGAGDNDLTNIIGQQTNDAAVLEFDFIPLSDSVRFRYVFSSEEYNEYACSNFTDVFAFLLTGPGYPAPGFNVARVPGTNVPIAINTVNIGAVGANGQIANCTPPAGALIYSQYFVNNPVGAPSIEFDGLTVVLTAEALVVPCSTYHIKLAIADAFDSAFDSAVFLEANSFSTNFLDIQVNTFNNDSLIVEGCSDATVNLNINSPADGDYAIPVTITGTATNGVDYTFVPDTFWILDGQTSTSFVLNALQDNITEGIEYMEIVFQSTICTFDTLILYINETGNVFDIPNRTFDICTGTAETLQFSAAFLGNPGLPGTYTWFPTGDLSDPTIYNPVATVDEPGTYYVFYAYGDCAQFDSIVVTSTYGINMPLQNDTALCQGGSVQLDVTTNTGPPSFSFPASGPVTVPSGTTVDIPIQVSGLFPLTMLTGELDCGVCLNITSAITGQVNIYLVSPNGTQVMLSTGNGGFGNGGYNNVCFTPLAPISITQYVFSPIPANAIVRPEQVNGFNTFVGGPVNGTWHLLVSTVPNGGLCTFNSVNLCFNNLNALTYNWTPAAGLSCTNCPNPVATPLNTTTYTCIATNAYGCTDTVDVTIGVGLLPSPLVTCGPTGMDFVTFEWNAVGGADGYEVSIDGGPFINVGQALSYVVNGLTPGQTVTIQVVALSPPGSPCADSQSGSLSCTAGGCTLLPANITGTLNICNGGNTVLTVNPAYTSYLWAPGGETTASITVTTPGTYDVTVTDGFGCTGTATATVVTGAPTPTITGVLAICIGATTTLDAGVYDGYAWSPGGQATQTITVGNAGTYIVTVTDANGCTGSTSATVTANGIATTITGPTGICPGTNSVLDAGAGFTSYLWAPGGATTQTITATVAGTYSVTVTGVGGCSATASTTLTVFPAPTATISGATTICNGTSTTLDAGAGFASYAWAPGGGNTQTINANAAGTYSVTVTDNNGCTASTSVSVTVITVATTITGPLSICAGSTTTLDAGAGFTSYTWAPNGEVTRTITTGVGGAYSVTVTDGNGCTASATVTVIVGAASVTIAGNLGICPGSSTTLDAGPGYATYTWQPGALNTQTITTNTPGTYTVTISDGQGCTGSASATVFNVTPPAPAIAGSTTICNGTSTTLDAGAGFSIYSWAPGGEATQSITTLTAGNYSVTVTDNNGCTGSASVVVTLAANLSPSITPNGPLAFCNGGSVELNAGVFDQYSWGNGETTPTITATTSGTYTVLVTNNNGCTGTASINVTANPNPIVDLGTDVDVCQGFSTTLTANVVSGTPAYTYAWDNGLAPVASMLVTPPSTTTYNVTVTDANGCTDTDDIIVTVNSNPVVNAGLDTTICNGTTATLSVAVTSGTAPYGYTWDNGLANLQTVAVTPLSTTTYNVTVGDQNGCTGTDAVTVIVNPVLSVNAGLDATICLNNATNLTATPTGGTAPYTYDWTGGLTGQTINVGPLVPTTYTVTITDAIGCTATDDVLVNVVQALTPGITTPGGALDFCFNTTLQLTADPGYLSYSWTGGATTQSMLANQSGTYTVSVTDATGCTGTNSITVTELLDIAVQGSVVDVSCFGLNDGVVAISGITGGTGIPNIYQWSVPGANGPVATGLVAGTYTVTVTDTKGCTGSASFTVAQPATAVGVSITGANVTCNGYANGVAIANPYGGTPAYTYQWSNGNITDTARFLAANVPYIVTVTDSRGCSASDTIVVDEPTAITLIMTNIVATRCHNSADGRARVNASGGTPGYVYQWSNGETNAQATALAAGTATVTVGDANGCTATLSVNISEPTPVNMNIINITPPNCNGLNTGSAIVVGSGGTPPYVGYLWDAGAGAQTTAAATGLPAGTYTVTITDFHQCTFVGTVVVPDPIVLSATVDELSPVLCNGDTTGSLVVNAVGGTGTYDYEWSNGETTAQIDNLPAGIYAVTVTDGGGCTFAVTAVIDEPDLLVLTALATSVLCNGDDDGEIALSAVGGRLPYEFSNDGGLTWQVGSNFDGLTADIYPVAVRDNNGCIDSFDVEVTEPDTFVATLLPIDTTIEFGQAVTLEVTTNAPATYTWVMDTTLSCLDCPNPIASPVMTHIYEVTVRDSNGCIVELASRVELIFPRRVYVANLFTPNGDGHNDLFLVQGGVGVRAVNVFRVYDRWGELVWEAQNVAPNDASGGWDGKFKGKPAPSGVFVWYAEILYEDGFTETIKGDLTLVR